MKGRLILDQFIKINCIKIYGKNMSLISTKCDFIKIFIEKEYIIFSE